MSPAAEDIEMQSTTPPSDTGNDSAPPWKNDVQCWRDVKAETGFWSYAEYLESLHGPGPQFKDLLEILNFRHRWRFDPSNSDQIFVLDVLKDGITSISLEMPAGLKPQSWLEVDRQSTQLLQHLQSPSESVLARIVFWSSPLDKDIPNSIIDAFGLGLKIQPAFFEKLLAISSIHSLRPDKMEYVRVGDNIATISRSYRKGDSPPVLLIAEKYDDDIDHRNHWEKLYHETVEELLGSEVGGSKSIYLTRRSPDSLAPISSNHYVNLINKNIHQRHGINGEAQAPLLIAFLTLLHVEIMGVRVRCQIVQLILLRVEYRNNHRDEFSDEEKAEVYDQLDHQRFSLRRKREGIEESRNRFVKYAQSQNGTTWLESKVWLSQVEDIGEAVIEARVREREALDYMQLQIGNLSILESRKSIDLSNKQMDEAKRGERCERLSFKETC